MAFVDELSLEGIEGMLLGRCEVAQPAWQRLVVGVSDALGEGADAGRLRVGHGRKQRSKMKPACFETRLGHSPPYILHRNKK